MYQQCTVWEPAAAVEAVPAYDDDPTSVVVSVSGGLDSDYAALWARRRWPHVPLILWHAHLALMDWHETREHLEQLAATLGSCRLVICQAVYALTGTRTPTGCNGTTLRRCHVVAEHGVWHGPARDDDPAVLANLVDFALRARNGQPPTAKIRYCTDYYKIRLFNTWARERRAELGPRAILLTGERWAESPQRARLPGRAWRDDLTLKPTAAHPDGWRMLWGRPGIDLPAAAVAQAVYAAGITPHPGYMAQGETRASLCDSQRPERGRARLSCRICIFSAQRHIQHAVINHPAMMADAVDAIHTYERVSGYSWQQHGPIAI
jgi:hypothetical protein